MSRKGSGSSTTADTSARIAELTERHRSLERERIRAEEQRKAAADELAQLERQAVEQHGTADLAELELQLKKLRAENAEACAEYEAHLDAIEERLAVVERAHRAAADDEEG